MSITAENLKFIYDEGTPFETMALEDISFSISNGEIVGIMGHTGCGKSTLIQLLVGLLEPREGTISIDGEDINDKRYDRKKLRSKVGIVFQYPEIQLFETTVYKDVAFGLKHADLPKEEVENRVRWALETTGFTYEKICGESPMGLSGGEKRRVAIAGVLATKPKYLILDEPIAGLDPMGRIEFLELLKRLNAEGVTILMVSHNADCIAKVAERIIALENGKLVINDEIHRVFADIEKLREMKIGVSRSREIADLLEREGWDIPKDTITYEELFSAILRELKHGAKI